MLSSKGAKHLLPRVITLLLILLVTVTPHANSQLAQSARPKLIVVAVVDQFSYDYLSRFGDKFQNGGFRYLLDNGASFTNCRYKQATTVTAVGHSVISSGAYPWATGVVSNEWYDRRHNAEVSAVADESVQLVGGNGAGASSKAMIGTTFADQLRFATNGHAKVISISLKDRSALFLAGKLANGAYWYDTRTGSFISSSQFGQSLPGWLKSFNDSHFADRYFGKTWQRLLPEAAYNASSRDDYAHEGALPGDGKQFPHVLSGGASAPSQPFYEAFCSSPFANDMMVEAAQSAIEGESLGQRGDPDMLLLSFSAPDRCGHCFGPYSQEAQDMMLRLDQTMAGFLQYVDRKIGLNKCVVVVTGDHGVAPIPEFLKDSAGSRGLDAGRIDPKTFKTLLNSAMSSRLGAGDWIASFLPPNLYLNLSEIDKQKYRQPEVESLAGKLARSIPGIADVFTAAQFFSNQIPSGPFTDAVRKSYFWGRSGELYVISRPGYIFSDSPAGTTHGSLYAYDQQVPLLLCGMGIRSGRFGQDSSPADIAPTICALLNIQVPCLNEGRVLQEALGQLSGPPAPLSSRSQ